MVGSDATLELAAQITSTCSHLTLVGLAGGTLEYGFFSLPYECQLTSTYWGSAVELMEVLDLARAGKITTHVERFELDQVADVYDRLRDGRLQGRAVICPHG